MEKLVDHILKHRKLILVLFFIAAAVGAVLSTKVGVDYDLTDYLPDTAKSTIALDTMEKEYDTPIPNARVMVEDVTIPEALELKDKIENVDGVNSVTWLDDSESVLQPTEMMDQDTLETYYKDNDALFSVAVDTEKAETALAKIRTLTNKKISMSGEAVSTAASTESTEKEVAMITVIAVIVVFLILFLTTTSWAHPFVFMITIGVAVLISRGTNLLLGEISFVSNAAGSVLQLAVSMDYSIFLMNRFLDYYKGDTSPVDAMKQAMLKSFSSVSSSALTTIIGFAALILMKFKLGVDLGLVMSKAICISLVTVFMFLPPLILACYKLISRFEHKSFMPTFHKFSKFVTKVRVPAIIVFFLLVIPGYILQSQNSFYYGSSHILGKGTTYYEDTKNIQKTFGESNSMALLVPIGSTAKEASLSNDLKKLSYIGDVVSYVDNAGASVPKEYLDDETRSKLDSSDYTRMVLTVNTEDEGDNAFKAVEEIRKTAKKYYGDKYLLAGGTVSSYDMRDVTSTDMEVVNTVAIVAVFLTILITTKSLILPIILVLVIEGAIWVNLSVPVVSHETLFYIAYLIISSIQLGATVDYAICLSDRYIETRKTREKLPALDHAIRYSTLPILTSGSILTIAGFILGKVCTHGVLSELGYLLFRGTILSLIFVLLVLPGLLYLLDKPILTLRLDNLRKKEEV